MYHIFLRSRAGFTLVELVVSTTILLLIVSGISWTLIHISNNLTNTQTENLAHDDIKDFIFESYRFQYTTGTLLQSADKHDTILLYSESGGIILGVFPKTASGQNFVLSPDDVTYREEFFGFFRVNNFVLDQLLQNTGSIYTLPLNDGKLYTKVPINTLKVQTYNSGNILDLQLAIPYQLKPSMIGQNKSITPLPTDTYFTVNFFF